MISSTPFESSWDGPFGLPPFDRIETAHLRPALDAALARHRDEIAAIREDGAAPGFAVIEAMERSGRALSRWGAVFWTLAGTCSDEDIRALEREAAPLLARHDSALWMDPILAARIAAIPEGGLDDEQRCVLKLHLERFERSGALLDAPARKRLAEIMEELAGLGARFSQNVLADEAGWTLPLGETDLEGLPEGLVAAAKRAARDRGLEGWAITLARSSVEPFLQFSARRDLRETAWRAWTARGENGGETDNRAIISRILALRSERARLLGRPSFAALKLAPQMAKTPQTARDLMRRVWGPARARAGREAARLAEIAAEEGMNDPIAPWDWRFYAEKVRKRDHDLDEAELEPYLALDAMIAAAMDCAGRLFGLEFAEIEGAPLHHPDARAWEVTRGGAHVGVFVGDWFARPSKRSGAWMSALRSQENFDPAIGAVRPIVINVANFAKGAEGAPALLSFDDARTLFHEFGHALHGLLSDVRYPFVSGTSVARDFVELPSQLFEHWLTVPEVLAAHARHVESGEPMPPELVARLIAAETFNQGFATVEYLACALYDLEAHMAAEAADGAADVDPDALERSVLAQIGMPEAIAMRHRPPHFLHVYAGDGYSAGYYSYMWSEVMDADAFEAFQEAGGPFDAETAKRLERHVLSAGGRQDPAEAWRAFRGREPDVAALLRQRGLEEPEAT